MPKPPVKSVVVRFRAYPKELAAWKRLAHADAMTLSMWLRDGANARLWLRDGANARLDESPARSVTGRAARTSP